MKRNLLLLGVLFLPMLHYAQVGINTTTPGSTLDVVAKNSAGATTNVDGLLVPRVDRLRAQSMTSVPTSTLIYINDASTGSQTGIAANIDTVGHYFYNGTVWVKMSNPTGAVNIYNADGSLTGNRLVTQGANTLAFGSTAVNGFSVAGNTLSVDGANGRVGIGTATPNGQLELGQVTANRKIVLYGSFNNDNQFYGFGVNSGILRYQADVLGTDHVFYVGTSPTTSNELFRIKGTGNVGINTSTPSALLDVNGTARVRTLAAGAAADNIVTADALGNLRQTAFGTFAGTTSWGLLGNAATNPATNFVGTTDAQDFVTRTNNTEKMRVTSAGKVAIGTTTPNGKLSVSGSGAGTVPILSLTNTNVTSTDGQNPVLNIYPGYTSNGTSISEGNAYAVVFDQDPGTTSGGTVALYDFNGNIRYQNATSFSDRRLKSNIKELTEYGLNTVMSLKPSKYIFNPSKKEDIGFIAQDLKTLIPEVVSGDDKIMYSVDYSKLTVVLAKAIQEQQAEIKALRADVEALKAKK